MVKTEPDLPLVFTHASIIQVPPKTAICIQSDHKPCYVHLFLLHFQYILFCGNALLFCDFAQAVQKLQNSDCQENCPEDPLPASC